MDYVQHLRHTLIRWSARILPFYMAIFSNGTHHVLIPHVVAIVTSERGLTVRVEVQGPGGDHLPAVVTVDNRTGQLSSVGGKLSSMNCSKNIYASGGDNAVKVATDPF